MKAPLFLASAFIAGRVAAFSIPRHGTIIGRTGVRRCFAPCRSAAIPEAPAEPAFGAPSRASVLAAPDFEEKHLSVDFAINASILALVVGLIVYKLATFDIELSRGWSMWELALRLPSDVWSAYLETLEQSPVIVKGLTSATVYAVGDGTAQMHAGRSLADLDRGRVVRSAVAGLIGHGPLSHYWYIVSDHFFSFVGWNTAWWGIGPKIALDQLAWGPLWNSLYVVLIGAMKADKLGEIANTVRTTSLPLLVSGLRLWPLAHMVTYNLPIQHRLMWVDAVEILWVMILSRQAASDGTDGHGAAADASAPLAAVAEAETPK